MAKYVCLFLFVVQPPGSMITLAENRKYLPIIELPQLPNKEVASPQ